MNTKSTKNKSNNEEPDTLFVPPTQISWTTTLPSHDLDIEIHLRLIAFRSFIACQFKIFPFIHSIVCQVHQINRFNIWKWVTTIVTQHKSHRFFSSHRERIKFIVGCLNVHWGENFKVVQPYKIFKIDEIIKGKLC